MLEILIHLCSFGSHFVACLALIKRERERERDFVACLALIKREREQPPMRQVYWENVEKFGDGGSQLNSPRRG